MRDPDIPGPLPSPHCTVQRHFAGQLAECHGETLKWLQEWLVKARILRSDRRKFVILDKISGIIPPSRVCLLLGPPGSGKSSLMQALAGKLDAPDLRISGEITYNGHTFKEFVPQRTSAYVNQYDEHMAELTVRETLDFSRRVQGAGSREGAVQHLFIPFPAARSTSFQKLILVLIESPSCMRALRDLHIKGLSQNGIPIFETNYAHQNFRETRSMYI